jgi:integrase
MAAGSVVRRTYTNKDGKRTIRWRARYPKPNAKHPTDQIEKLFSRRADAEAWIHEQQAAIASGTHVTPSFGGRRFKDVYEVWKETRWPGLEPKTTARYASIWRTYLEPEFGNRKLNTITRELVRAYFARLTHGGRAPGTVRKVHSTLRTIMAEAVELGWIKVNPCVGVKGLPRAANREMLFLTPQEVHAVAQRIDPYYRVLVLTAAYTGLRAGELGGLRRMDVDLLRGVIHVRQALKEVDGHLMMGPVKTSSSRRSVTLPAFLRKELEAHLDGIEDTVAGALVFPGEKGGPMRHSHFYKRHWRWAVAGRPATRRKPAEPGALPPDKHGLRFHDLRHTAASIAINASAHPLLVSKWLGHASVTITLDTY